MVRLTGATWIRRLSISIDENINMRKDIRKSALDKGEVPPVDEGSVPDEESDLVVPSVTTQRGKWNRGNIAYTRAANDNDSDCALGKYYRDYFEIKNIISKNESHFQETKKPIGKNNAKILVVRVKDLHKSIPFEAHADYVVFLAGQCLTLKEGKSVGEVYTAFVGLQIANPPPAFPARRGKWRNIKLAVPAGLINVFGTQSYTWYGYRSEDFARDYERKGFPPDSVSYRLFDGGDCSCLLDPAFRSSQPEPDSIPVVLAPDETTIAQYIERAEKSVDHWDALSKVVAILCEHRQPLGDALSDWMRETASGRAKRPKGSTAAQWTKNALRNHAICEAIQALDRCGMKAQASDREPGLACCVCAKVFGSATKDLTAKSVLNIWKRRGIFLA